jgi:soluble lytic murein transglycosylase
MNGCQAARLCFALTLVVSSAAAQGGASPLSEKLSDLSGQLASSNALENRNRLIEFAAQASGAEQGLALLAVGLAEYDAKHYAEAAKILERAEGHAGLLNDYAAYYRGRSLVLADDFESALQPLQNFVADHSESRFVPAARRLIVESLVRLNRLDEARGLLAGGFSLDPVVHRYLSAGVAALKDNPLQAVALYRDVYYDYPTSDQADPSEKKLADLRRLLGGRYPKASADQRLRRADLLYSAGAYAKSSSEYGLAISAGLGVNERQRAQVRKGAADYHRRWTNTAYNSLLKLKIDDPDLDAERLYYLCATARRKRLITKFLATVADLGTKYPKSPWYEEALFAAGNYYLLQNNPAKYREYYGRAANLFPSGKHSAASHWKVAWRAYLDDDPRRRQLLEEHLDRYPAATTASSAMYWLGRIAEQDGQPGQAHSLYDAIVQRYPNYYYATLARRRIAAMGANPSISEDTSSDYLASLKKRLPAARRISAGPSAETQRLIERGSLLNAIGRKDVASKELLTADYQARDAHLVGLELSRLSHERGDHFRAMRLMKRYGYGYLRFPIEVVDRKFWEYLYPLAWEQSLRSRSTKHGLDPYLVAALIRQESEFNPSARSRSGALGLMQVMPKTGEWLFGRLGMPNYSKAKLTQPDISLRLGTFHLKNVIDRFKGNLEFALAGYNAGEHRVDTWRPLGNFDEPGEFVETIPFSETRGYVQAVIRNQEMYRRLYDAPTPRKSTFSAAVD